MGQLVDGGALHKAEWSKGEGAVGKGRGLSGTDDGGRFGKNWMGLLLALERVFILHVVPVRLVGGVALVGVSLVGFAVAVTQSGSSERADGGLACGCSSEAAAQGWVCGGPTVESQEL